MNTGSGRTTINLGATAGRPQTGFTSVDVGSPQLSGTAKPVGDGLEVIAGGADICEKSDQFHFVFKPFTGDFDMAVRVESFAAAHLYSKAGLMIRETLDAGSPHLMFLVFAGNAPRNNNLGGYEMQFRAVTDGDCQAVYPIVRPPAPPEFPVDFPNSWLRVQRRGNLFSAHASTDGKTWKFYGKQELALAGSIKAGPAVTSHDAAEAAKVVFRDYTEFR